MRSRLNLPLALLVALAALGPAPASASPSPIVVAGSPAGDAEVGIDDAGRARVIYRDGKYYLGSVTTRVFNRDGTPAGDPQVIVPGPVFEFDAAISGSGAAVVAWSNYDSEDASVWLAYITADGTIGAPVQLSDSPSCVLAPQVAIDPAGNATVVYADDGIATARIGADGDVGPIETIPVADTRCEMDVAAYAGGALVAFSNTEGQLSGRITVARLEDGSSPSAPVSVSSAAGFGLDPALAAQPSGRAVVTWVRHSREETIQAALLPAGGPPGRVHQVSDGKIPYPAPRAALDPRGRILIGWAGGEGGAYGYDLGTSAGRFGRDVTLAGTRWSGWPDVMAGPDGDFRMVWPSRSRRGSGEVATVRELRLSRSGRRRIYTLRRLRDPGRIFGVREDLHRGGGSAVVWDEPVPGGGKDQRRVMLLLRP